MGSFNVQCCITKQDIEESRGEKVYLLPIIEKPESFNVEFKLFEKQYKRNGSYNWFLLDKNLLTYSLDYWTPKTGFIFPAVYDDYGRFNVDFGNSEFKQFLETLLKSKNLAITLQGENKCHDFAFDATEFLPLLDDKTDILVKEELWKNLQEIVFENRLFINAFPYSFLEDKDWFGLFGFMVVKQSAVELFFNGLNYLKDNSENEYVREDCKNFLEDLNERPQPLAKEFKLIASMLSRFNLKIEPVQGTGQDSSFAKEYAIFINTFVKKENEKLIEELLEEVGNDEDDEFYQEEMKAIAKEFEEIGKAYDRIF